MIGESPRSRPYARAVTAASDRVRAGAARAVELAYNLAVMVTGELLSESTTDEIPAEQHRERRATRELVGSLTAVWGFARLLARLGGPSFTLAGSIRRTSLGDVFCPSTWWIERGAREVLVSGDSN